MMRSAVIAMMVAALMILRAAAYPGLTTEPPAPLSPYCPDQSWCTGDCQLDYSAEGCPNCVCPDSFCQVVTCVSSEECNQNNECYYGRCYSCMYIGLTSSEPPTTSEPPTPSEPPTTSEPPTPSTRPTTPCFMVTCGYNCGYATGEDGCPMCDCHPTCMDETCGPNERCIMMDVQCNEPRCFPVPTCMRYDGPVRPTTETSTWAPTTSPCSDTWCGDGPFCFLDYSSGVCGCICVDPQCMMEGCPYEGQECLPTGECRACYECFPKYDDTTTMTPTPTTSPCSDVLCDGAPFCFPDNSSGFCACLCFDPICMLEGCPHEGQQCLPTGECPTCYECLPKFDDTTTPTPTPTPTTSPCSDMWCGDGPLCFPDYSFGVCTCLCVDPKCMLEGCPHEGQQCLPTGECSTCYECLPKFDDTTTPIPTTTPTDSPCSETWCRPPFCIIDHSTGGCVTQYPKCMLQGCPEDQQCVATGECPTCYGCVPKFVSSTPTTPTSLSTGWCSQIYCPANCREFDGIDGCPTCDCTPKPPTSLSTDTPTPCPMVTCAPDCVSDTGSDGCTTCECPPSCKTVKCSAGHECQLVNVTCFRYPCFPQPQCVPVEDPCTGTPNPGRCGRGFKTRWTYNLQNDTCESFRYYGCTPSPNTFRSRKECKNKCTGNSQIVCATVVCEDDCYTLERQDECPLCICPNPCKEFKCRKGYECKMRESKCKKGAKPFCAKSPCPPQDPCGIRCMYGLKTDKNGCQLCECLEEPTP